MENFEIGFIVRDKKGVEIKEGDVIKMFHFTSRLRRQKQYMYKVAVLWNGRMYAAHLDDVLKKLVIKPSFPLCTSLNDNGLRLDSEIIQSMSYECYDLRYRNRFIEKN